LVRNYRKKSHLKHLKESIYKIILDNRNNVLEMFNKAKMLNIKAENILKSKKQLTNLHDAVVLYAETALYCTILPHFVLM